MRHRGACSACSAALLEVAWPAKALSKAYKVLYITPIRYITNTRFGTAQIIRGVALGLAFIMYAREEGAETLIEQMTRDQDPILRCAVRACVRLGAWI